MKVQIATKTNEEIVELQEWIEESQISGIRKMSVKTHASGNKGSNKVGMSIDYTNIIEVAIAIGTTATAAAFVNGIFGTIKGWLEYKAKIKEIKSKENEVSLKIGNNELKINMNNIDKLNQFKEEYTQYLIDESQSVHENNNKEPTEK